MHLFPLALALTTPPITRRSGHAVAMVATARSINDACELDNPAIICAYNPKEIDERFASRQAEVAGRVANIGLAALRIRLADDGGATLRAELSKLGPVPNRPDKTAGHEDRPT